MYLTKSLMLHLDYTGCERYLLRYKIHYEIMENK